MLRTAPIVAQNVTEKCERHNIHNNFRESSTVRFNKSKAKLFSVDTPWKKPAVSCLRIKKVFVVLNNLVHTKNKSAYFLVKWRQDQNIS